MLSKRMSLAAASSCGSLAESSFMARSPFSRLVQTCSLLLCSWDLVPAPVVPQCRAQSTRSIGGHSHSALITSGRGRYMRRITNHSLSEGHGSQFASCSCPGDSACKQIVSPPFWSFLSPVVVPRIEYRPIGLATRFRSFPYIASDQNESAGGILLASKWSSYR